MSVVQGFTLPHLPEIMSRSAQITGILVPLIAVFVAMQQVLSSLGAKETSGDFVTGNGGYYADLFTSMAIVFVTGMILESLSIAVSVGIHPIHFAVIFPVGATIGFITPPVGLNLYAASGVTRVPYFRLLGYATCFMSRFLLCGWASLLFRHSARHSSQAAGGIVCYPAPAAAKGPASIAQKPRLHSHFHRMFQHR